MYLFSSIQYSFPLHLSHSAIDPNLHHLTSAQLEKPHGNQHCCAQALNKVKILAYYIIDVVLSMLHDSHSFPIVSRADSLALQASSQA